MTLEDALRLTRAEDESFNQTRTVDGQAGVWLVKAQLSERDANILGVGFLAGHKFTSHKMDEDLEDVGIEFSTSGDVAPHELDPEKIGKPIIEPLEGSLQVTLRIHVKDNHIAVINEFFQRLDPAPFSLFVRPRQANLFADQQPAPEYTPTAEEIEEKEQHEAEVGAIAHWRATNNKGRACISVVESSDGFRAGYDARLKFRHERTIASEATEMLPLVSESQARAVAAQKLTEFARTVIDAGVATAEKKTAQELINWCEQWVAVEQRLSGNVVEMPGEAIQ